MDITGAELGQAISRLRHSHAGKASALTQAHVIRVLTEFARCWRDQSFEPRRRAESIIDPFPFAMVEVSLNALLDSLTPERLWGLIDSEDVRGACGQPLIGQVIAGNTPLLSWVAVIRALLVGSASLVKLPSGPASVWGLLFQESLREVSPELAECVLMARWPGGTTELDTALCGGVDLLMASGGDDTLRALRALCPAGTPFVGYGHRVSFGLATRGSAHAEAADGFARDVLLYDQGGCLSPHTIFVEGDRRQVEEFAALLAAALSRAVCRYPLPVRDGEAAGAVREARALAQMDDGVTLWADPTLRWTVIARPERAFAASPTFGVVSVQPLESLSDLPEALAPVSAFLQGCAVAGEALDYLPGVSYLCAPGDLQSPPLSWRQDVRDVLRLLVR